MDDIFLKCNYCDLKKEFFSKEKSHFHILPIPYEATTSYGQGTAKGPKAIIDASTYMETYDEELRQETYKLGIHTLPFFSPSKNKPEILADELTKYVAKEISLFKNDKFIICMGGEHSISPSIVKAFKNKYSDISVLHLDAHADLRDSFKGSKYSHGCANRRILESCHSISCGIRSLSQEEADFINRSGTHVYFGKNALNRVNEIKSLLSNNVYITLDVDVLDPSIMPSTGTPEPDGWDWRELCNFLKNIILNRNVVGMDVVELAPMSGNNAPDYTMAKLIYRIMGYIALSKKWKITKN